MDGREVIISSNNNKLLKKKIILTGDFSSSPSEGTKCNIELSDVSCRSEGKEVPPDNGSYIFNGNFAGHLTVGEGTNYLDIDFERCLQHVCVDEVCLLQMTYFKGETEVLEISCVVKMVSMEDAVLFCDWHWAKKFHHANKHKDAGVDLVRQNRTVDAFRQFSKALKFILTFGAEDFESMSDEDKKVVVDLKLKLYNNLAHCQLQHGEYRATIRLCDKALEIDETNVKSLYRRGSAYMGLEDWEAAHRDMSQVLVLDQSVSEAKSKMSTLKEKVKDINDAYKKAIKNMFT